MRRSEARRVLAAYVSDRLTRECAERGKAASIARTIGFSPAHISNARTGQAGVGEDLAEALAKYWGLSYEELQKEAVAWAEGGGRLPPSLTVGARHLRDRPEWNEAVAGARQVFRVPDEYFDRVGAIFDDFPTAIDAQFVGEMARVIYELAQRDKQPTSVPRPTSPAPVAKAAKKARH